MNTDHWSQKPDIEPGVGVEALLAAIWRRKWLLLVTTLVCLGAAALVTQHMTKLWRASAQMVLTQRPVSLPMSQQGSVEQPPESVETQIGMLQSDGMMERTIVWLKNDTISKGQSFSLIPQDLSRAVNVTNPRDSALINVTADAPSADQASLLANALCQAFVDWKVDIARKDVQTAEDKLSGKVRSAKAEMDRAERAQLNYQQTNHLLDVAAQQHAAIQQLNTQEAIIAALQQDKASQDARLAQMRSQLQTADLAIKGGGVRDDTRVLSFQTQLDQLKTERFDAAQKYTPAYGGILPDLDAKIRTVQKQLNDAIQASISDRPSLATQGLLYQQYNQAKIDNAYTTAKLDKSVQLRDQIKGEMDQMPEIGLTSDRLARDADLARQQYAGLEVALNQTRLEKNRITGNIQITQAAMVGDMPFRPNWKLNLLLGGVFGLCLSLGMILMLENMDDRVRTTADVYQLGSSQIIGVLPRLSRRKALAMAEGRTLPEVENAFDIARVNLVSVMRGQISQGLPLRGVILVTSAVPGEGKSLSAVQLARSLSETGIRVILMDANLRRTGLAPSADRNRIGLADVLTGETTLDDAIKKTPVAGLFMLPAGVSDRSSTALLSSPNLSHVMSDLQDRADVIVIDAPDCTTTADTILLTPFAKCIVQVVGLGRVGASVMQSTGAVLQSLNKISVCLINNGPRVNPKRPDKKVPLLVTPSQNVTLMGSYVPLGRRPEDKLESLRDGEAIEDTAVMASSTAKRVD